MRIGQKKRLSLGVKSSLAVMAGTALSIGAKAEKTELEWDTDLARKLISYETQNLKDLAVLQLEKMVKLYPAQKDLINLLMAESYHLQNQNKSFDQTIAKISKTSPLYSEALLLRTQRELKRGKMDAALAVYEEFFQINPKPSDVDDKDTVDAWTRTVDLYSAALSKAGQTEKAQEVKEWNEAYADEFELRKIAFETAKIELDALELAEDVKDPVLSLNGKNAFVKIPNVQLSSSYTIEGLYFQETNQTDYLVVAAKPKDLKNYYVTLGTFGKEPHKNNKLTASHTTPPKKAHKITGNNYNDGEWHHFALTFNGKALKLYRDGKIIAEKTDQIAAIGNVKSDFYFGWNCAKGYFKGQLDNLRLWNRALPGKEINDNMLESVKTGKGLVFSYSFDGKKADDKKATLNSPSWKEKSVRELSLKKNIQRLKQNTFKNDYISFLSQVEMARAYWLLGDYKQAVTVIRQGAELMNEFEKSMRKSKHDINASPLAGSFYYYGMSYKSIADAAKKSGDSKKATKAFSGAVKQLANVVAKYPQSPYTGKSRVALASIRESAVELGWTEDQLDAIDSAKGSGVDAASEGGYAFFRNGEYEKASESYRKALGASMKGDKIKSILYYMTLSAIKNPDRKISNSGKCWEAEAIADYLLRAYPTSDEAVSVCLSMGGMYGSELKKEGLAPEQVAKLTDSTLRWFGEFIYMRPKDERAPDLKYKIAENSRKKTLDIIAEMKTVKDDAKKLDELNISLTRELYKVIPQYADIVEKYGETAYAVKSRFKLGLLYAQLEEYEKSADAYVDYVKTEKDTGALTQVHGASLSAGYQLMKAGLPEKSVAQYQATIDMVKASGKKDAQTRQLMEDAYSLMGVANDRTGEEAWKEVVSLKEQVRKLNGAIRDSEKLIRTIDKNVAKKEEANAEVNKEFKEVMDALSTGGLKLVEADIKPTDSEEQKQSKQAEADRTNKRLRQAALKKMRSEVAGEKIQLKVDLDNAKTELQRCSDKFNANSVTKSRAARDIKENEALIRVMDIRIEGVKKDKVRAVKQVASSQERLAKLEAELKEVRELMKSPIPTEVEAAQIKQVDLLDQLRPVKVAVKASMEQLQDAILAEQVDIKVYEKNKSDAQAKLIELKEQLKTATRDEELLTNLKDLYTKEVTAYEAGFVKNSLQAEVIKGKGSDTKVSAATEKYKTLLTEANKKFNEVAEQEKRYAKEDVATAKSNIESAKVKITELEKAQTPFMAVYKKYKMEAVKYFDQFLKLYPKSEKHGANNLAKAGSIYISFEQFEKAAIYLNRLKKDYPASPLVESTTFDLADAYVKIGRYSEAVAIYKNILKNTTDHSPAKMAGLQRRLLAAFEEKGDAAISLLDISAEAGMALHKKIMAKRATDKALYAQREVCLFRIAEAYFLQKKYDDALKYYEQLLSVNSKTGFLFEVNYKQGIAYRDKKNPELDKAVICFGQVTRFSDSAGMDMVYKAMVEAAVANAGKKNYAGVKEATAGLELVIAGYNPENKESIPTFERAYNMLTKYLAQLGQEEKAKKFVAEYKKNFPNGIHVKTIDRLPKKKYDAPVK